MKDLKSAIMMLIVFTIICGGIYPAVVTGIAHAVFPKQANGSFTTDKSGKEIGSTLIGQPFPTRNTSGRVPRPPPTSATIPWLRAAPTPVHQPRLPEDGW